MKIPSTLLKAVVFICYEDQTNHEIVPIGTGFFLGHNPKQGEITSARVWVVTALHVIRGLRQLGVKKVTLRLNPRDQNKPLIALTSDIDAWYFSIDNTLDVAILECGIPAEADHVVIPLSVCVTPQIFQDNEAGLGDEVFISGLFTHHFGNKRNLPIVRIGALAALADEKIATDQFGSIDGYLIEARSTGGLSGSPVFLNLGSVRMIGGQIKHHSDPNGAIFLLGMIHGHFLAKPTGQKISADDINAGIAIVIPTSSIQRVTDAYDTTHPLS